MKVVLPGEGGSTGIENGEGMKMNEGCHTVLPGEGGMGWE